MTQRHVVLVTYGEPPSADFLAQLRYSWRILLGLTRSVAPIPRPVLPLIALKRARLRRRTWTAEDYGSPLEPVTLRQSEGLGAELGKLAPDTRWRVHVAYEFRDPAIPTVLDRLPPQDPVDIVPMYATESAFTHEISRTTLNRWIEDRNGAAPSHRNRLRVLPAMDEAALAEVSIRHVRAALADRGYLTGPDCALVLAAHGTLLEPPRPMETGRLATERLCRLVAEGLAGDFGLIVNGWLNHVYGGRWTEPAIEDALRQVAEAGFRRAVYYPYGFVADNAESELEGRVALRGRPELAAVHLPCLNASPHYLEALARQIRDATPP